MNYLVDTNIISELSRLRPNAGVLDWAQHISRLTISVISLDEIFFGLAWHPNTRVRGWMEGFFQRHEVLPVDEGSRQNYNCWTCLAQLDRSCFPTQGSIIYVTVLYFH